LDAKAIVDARFIDIGRIIQVEIGAGESYLDIRYLQGLGCCIHGGLDVAGIGLPLQIPVGGIVALGKVQDKPAKVASGESGLFKLIKAGVVRIEGAFWKRIQMDREFLFSEMDQMLERQAGTRRAKRHGEKVQVVLHGGLPVVGPGLTDGPEEKASEEQSPAV
jgi:hypothetical protein